MKSTPYYAANSPNSLCRGSASALRPNFSAPVLPALAEYNPNTHTDPLEAFTRGKILILENIIGEVLKEIEKRELLMETALDTISNQECQLKTALMAVAPWGDSPSTLGDPRRRAALEKEIASLEAEKRSEETAAWKDIAGLKKELREVFREYLEERRKQQVMQN